MGFFPYFTPLYPWVVDEMQRREDNLISTTFKNPWVTIISPALVVKAGSATTTEQDSEKRITELQKIIGNNGDGLDSYSGCIISNNINNLELSYSTNQTILGVDFNGKHIKVVGESGRKISTPIIESIDVDTDGANNTLKTAKIKVICFSLKQLEMFELFFMKPGMNIMVEWGDNSLLMYDKFQLKGDPAPNSTVTGKNAYNKTGQNYDTDVYKRPEEAMTLYNDGNTNYDFFCENFSKYFRSDTTALANYLNRIQKSRGSYDLVAGKVLDYSFSVNENGTYSADFEVSQGNQMTQFLPKNASKSSANTTEKTPGVEISNYDTIVKQMVVDFDLEEKVFKKMLDRPHPEGTNGDWMDDWFNFIKINKEQKDTIASSQSYVSLRFILFILANYAIKETVTGNKELVDDFFMLKVPQWIVGNDKKYIIPCNSSKFMLSSNQQIIYPVSNPPKFEAPLYTDDKNAGKTELKNSGDKNEIQITSGSADSIKIGPYDFHVNETKIEHLIVEDPKKPDFVFAPTITVPTNSSRKLGNALNIFLNYDTVVKHWKRAYTRKDFLEEILNMCNNNSYGLFRLVYGNMGENGGPISGPTILDVKFQGFEDMYPKKDEITYRFKPTTINSIVKQFSFNFEMSNLVAGRTIFNSSKFLEEAIKIQKEKNPNQQVVVDTLPLPPDAYKSVDNSTFGNADGWYSINKVEFKTIEKKWEQIKNVDKSGGTIGDKSSKEDNKEATKEVEDLREVIKNKSVFFLINEKDDDNKKMMIFQDTPLIQGQIQIQEKNKTPIVSPIDVSITIDGFSGFSCGQYFNIDGIPEIYNTLGVFQITNTKHNITKDGWTTTIEASYRITNKK